MDTPVAHLYRSPTNRIFFGVCGGLGEYWRIDPVVIRFMWMIVTIFTGVAPGIAAYILAIFIIPERRRNMREAQTRSASEETTETTRDA